ncbi:hypothetical protein ACWDCL_14310 [Streptomyces sp. NPDC001009]
MTNGALVALAEHRHDELSASARWLLCASVAVYAQAASGAGMRPGALLTHSLPPLALITGTFGGRLPAGTVVWLLVAAAVWALRD